AATRARGEGQNDGPRLAALQPVLAGELTRLAGEGVALQLAPLVAAGAPVVELHTGAFAEAWGTDAAAEELERLRRACIRAHALGLVVNAGHGINYANVAAVMTLPHLHELNIGHAIVSRSLVRGARAAVAEMKSLLRRS
ncbi:MAG: pyridoxine 5'-phosphate synthase, partial [Opitutales bacterium]